MTTVEFQNVGRMKATWTATLRDFTETALYREVKRKGVLGSKDIDFYYNDTDNAGLIYVGGFRMVGSFRVVTEGDA